jgi:hypothetical protein
MSAVSHRERLRRRGCQGARRVPPPGRGGRRSITTSSPGLACTSRPSRPWPRFRGSDVSASTCSGGTRRGVSPNPAPVSRARQPGHASPAGVQLRRAAAEVARGSRGGVQPPEGRGLPSRRAAPACVHAHGLREICQASFAFRHPFRMWSNRAVSCTSCSRPAAPVHETSTAKSSPAVRRRGYPTSRRDLAEPRRIRQVHAVWSASIAAAIRFVVRIPRAPPFAPPPPVRDHEACPNGGATNRSQTVRIHAEAWPASAYDRAPGPCRPSRRQAGPWIARNDGSSRSARCPRRHAANSPTAARPTSRGRSPPGVTGDRDNHAHAAPTPSICPTAPERTGATGVHGHSPPAPPRRRLQLLRGDAHHGLVAGARPEQPPLDRVGRTGGPSSPCARR